MKKIIYVIAGLFIAGLIGFVVMAAKSRSGESGLSTDRLDPCPSSPNCVTSLPGAKPDQSVAPFNVADWESIPEAITETGGKISSQADNFINATYRSRLFGFIDDVQFSRQDGAVHVRSSSRAGHSDMGANKKRVDALRASLKAQ